MDRQRQLRGAAKSFLPVVEGVFLMAVAVQIFSGIFLVTQKGIIILGCIVTFLIIFRMSRLKMPDS